MLGGASTVARRVREGFSPLARGLGCLCDEHRTVFITDLDQLGDSRVTDIVAGLVEVDKHGDTERIEIRG